MPTASGIGSMSTAYLFWGLVFSSVGVGYFLYGKKQTRLMAMICGIGLMIYPFFVSSTGWIIVIGSLLMAIPYFVRM